MKTLQCNATLTMLLKTFLYDKRISKKSLSAIKKNGALFVNGEHATVRKVLDQGDKVEVCLSNETLNSNLERGDMTLRSLYAVEWLDIVSQPALINTVPSRERQVDSLGVAVLDQQN